MKLFKAYSADSYKFSHIYQYRPGTQFISSYIESRGCDRNWKQVVNAGIQYHLQEYLSQPLITNTSLQQLQQWVPEHGVSFNYDAWKYLLDKHNGMAPLHVQALPEGLVVPLGTPMVQVVNTDPNCAWVTSFIETALLRSIWYMSTVATQSFHIKRIIRDAMMQTAGHTEGLDFKLHDFGARGVSSSESAQIGGAAHLFSFLGSDTFEAIPMLKMYYSMEGMPSYSIDAAEHSTVTSFGGPQFEKDAYEHLINTFGKEGKIFAIVSDSYDLYGAIDNIYGDTLKSSVENLGNRSSKLVVRPDSGDPVIVVSDTIEKLMDKFGYTENQKGYKVLPPYLGVIQGDGINETSIKQILAVMKLKGLSAENIAFGMGGQLLQGINRDTLKFAMKANEATNVTFNEGKPYPVFKQPATDSGKTSKKGRQAVIGDNVIFGGIQSISEKDFDPNGYPNLLETVYLDGEVKRLDTLDNIRKRVNDAL
jgi:nicotinamide phosphoribosyltransferase